MLLTAGLSPVTQLFAATSCPSPFELAPVAPEWPITPMASSSGVRLTFVGVGPASSGSADREDGATVVGEAVGSSSEPQPARARAATARVASAARVVMVTDLLDDDVSTRLGLGASWHRCWLIRP